MNTEPIRRRQIESWQRGERLSVQRLVAEAGEKLDDDAVMELVYAEVVLREELGEKATPAEYIAAFPHLAEALRRQFEVHELLGPIAAVQSLSLLLSNGGGVSSGHEETIVHATSNRSTAPQEPAVARRRPLPKVPGYEIVRELGRGGMGVVYQARHLQLRRTVALKMILDNALGVGAVRDRFRVEAAAVARLQHANIVQIYDFNEAGDHPYFSLEYIAGGSLAEFTQRRPQPIAAAVAVTATLARALDHAHRQGIVHRDLKPANILLARGTAEESSAGEIAPPSSNSESLAMTDFQPKLTDFGLAKNLVEGDNLTHTEAVLGTYLYMSPEQAQGKSREVGPAADIHALGLILYELLTGTAPFQTPSLAATLDAVRFTEPPPPSSLRLENPAELDAICRRCLQKKPELRYPTAGELADELERWANGLPLQNTCLARPSWSRGRVAVAAAIAALFLTAGGALWFGSGRESPPTIVAPVATAVRTEPESFAVLIGVRSYRLPGQELDLEFTESDVDELSRVLFKQGFPRKNIKLLTQWNETDNADLAPNGKNIREQLSRTLSACIPGDTVLVAITGMGGSRDRPQLYGYLPADGDPESPESLLMLSDFYDLFRQCPAERKLLLVDTCQSVSLSLPSSTDSADPPPGTAVLFACGHHQSSLEDRDLRHGVFSYFVLKALEGAADEDSNGVITLGELRDFTTSNVVNFVRDKYLPDAAANVEENFPNGIQTPQLEGTMPDSAPLVVLKSKN